MVQTNQPKHNELLSGYTGMIVGFPKTGKTTQTAKWGNNGVKDVLLIDTDLGSDLVECNRIIIADTKFEKVVGNEKKVCFEGINIPTRPVLENGKPVIKDGVMKVEIVPPKERGYIYRNGENNGKPMPVYSLVEVYKYIQKELIAGTFPYKTVVIDTLNQVYDWIEEAVKFELNIGSMGEAPWGTDWGMLKRKGIDILKRFQKLLSKHGINLIYTTHAKQSTKLEGKKSIVQLVPDMTKSLAKYSEAKADWIGVTKRTAEGQFIISFDGYDEIEVGSRFKALQGKEIEFSYKAFKHEITSYKE